MNIIIFNKTIYLLYLRIKVFTIFNPLREIINWLRKNLTFFVLI